MDAGNTVVVIEHNLDVIKTADWLIDMGPEGGSRGGQVIAEGTPEQIAAHRDSHTGTFLRPILEGRDVPVGAAQPELVVANGRRPGRPAGGGGQPEVGRQEGDRPEEPGQEGRGPAGPGSGGQLTAERLSVRPSVEPKARLPRLDH